MRVTVKDLLADEDAIFEGTDEQVREQLLRRFRFLARHDDEPTEELLAQVDALQNYQVEGQAEEPPLAKVEDPFEAARWLTHGPEVGAPAKRAALWRADGDAVRAALDLYGVDDSDRARRSVEAWLRATHEAPGSSVRQEVPLREVTALHAEGARVAAAVRRAAEAGQVFAARMGGSPRHSDGTLVATDPETGEVVRLKPDSSAPEAAAGARQDPSTEPQREAAFYHAAQAWGLGQWVPPADLVQADGREYAAIPLLPRRFCLLSEVLARDPNAAQRLFHRFLGDGTLHRWAVLDYVLGNPDRHDSNVMTDGHDVRLIDHGSAFAGDAFDPARDRASFVPYYLRCWGGWRNAAPAEERLRRMPRLGAAGDEWLREWLLGLDWQAVADVLARYGVSGGASEARLARLAASVQSGSASAAVDRLWVE